MVKVRICPKCKSAKLQQESTKGLNFIAGVQPIYTCNECSHSGSIFPEIEEEEFMKYANNNSQ